MIQTGLRARPEMAAAQAGLAAADALVRQSKMAPLLPRVQADFIGGGLSGGRNDDFSPLQSQYNAGVALVWNLEAFGLGNAAQIRGRRAGYDARDVSAAARSRRSSPVRWSRRPRRPAARFETLDAAQEAVRQARGDVSQAPRGVVRRWSARRAQFDALEPLTAVQALNQARVQYLQQVVEFNRSQFRLYAAIGQPALCGLDGAVAQPVAVPVVPPAPGAVPKPLPNPRPVPAPPIPGG